MDFVKTVRTCFPVRLIMALVLLSAPAFGETHRYLVVIPGDQTSQGGPFCHGVLSSSGLDIAEESEPSGGGPYSEIDWADAFVNGIDGFSGYSTAGPYAYGPGQAFTVTGPTGFLWGLADRLGSGCPSNFSGLSVPTIGGQPVVLSSGVTVTRVTMGVPVPVMDSVGLWVLTAILLGLGALVIIRRNRPGRDAALSG